MSSNKLGELLDLYSEPVNFSYKKRKYFPTLFGASITILIFGVLFLYFAILIYQMSLREAPSILTNKMIHNKPNPVSVWKDISYDDLNATRSLIPEAMLNQTGYFYTTIGIRYSNGPDFYLIPLDETYLELVVEQVQIVNGELESTPLNVQKCPKFGNFNKSQFESLTLNETYCFNDNYTLSGIQGAEGSSWVELKISYCQNKSTCHTEEEIVAYLENIQFEFYYQNRNMNTTAFGDNLISSEILEVYWDIVPAFSIITTCEIGIDRIRSYDGYFPDFLQPQYTQTFSFMVRKFESQLADLNKNRRILVLMFVPSRENSVIWRRFDDVLSQAAVVGGISTIIIMIGYLIVVLFSNFYYEESLMNDFYNVVPPEKNKEIVKSFDDFLREQYNILVRKYFYKFDKLRSHVIITIPKEVEMEEKKSEEKVEEKVEDEENLGSQKEKSLPAASNKKIDSEGDNLILIKANTLFDENLDRNLNDDEGIAKTFSNSDELNALKRHFTMKRIESLFSLSKTDRDNFLQNIREKNDNNVDFFDLLLAEKKKTSLFYIEKIVYNIFLYSSNDKMYFNVCEMFLKLFCCCCIKRRKAKETKVKIKPGLKQLTQVDKGKNLTNLGKKIKIFKTAEMRLGLDFDLVSVLKTVDNFEKFTKVYFDHTQAEVFDSVNKPTIKVLSLDEQEEMDEDLDENGNVKTEIESDLEMLTEIRQLLIEIMKEGKVTNVEKNIFINMGIELEEIKQFAEVMKEAKALNAAEKNNLPQGENLKQEIQHTIEKKEDGETEEAGNDNWIIEENNPDLIKEINNVFLK